MKRKLISMLLCFTMLFSLSACGASSAEEPTGNTTVQPESESTDTEENSELTNTQDDTANTDSEETVSTDTEAADPDVNTGDSGSDTDSEEAVLTIDYASEDLLAQPDNYYECIVTESDWQVKAVITTNVPVKNLKVVSLNYEDTGADDVMNFQIAEELYSLDELTAEKPLVIGTEFAGIVPTLGITYTDETGTEKLLAIDMSGENDSLLLSEANLIQRGR